MPAADRHSELQIVRFDIGSNIPAGLLGLAVEFVKTCSHFRLVRNRFQVGGESQDPVGSTVSQFESLFESPQRVFNRPA